jgi:hypothetical protein
MGGDERNEDIGLSEKNLRGSERFARGADVQSP